MKKVTTINLNGRAYQVEESGYTALRDYIDTAEKTLSTNPDKIDILADIEQAIADKCDAELTNGKNVVTAVAIETIITKVGTVETSQNSEDQDPEASKDEESRKLYSLPKEGKLSGVCAGLAAYLGMDVTIMRLLFVVLLFLTQGFMIIVYIVLAIAMPEAKTGEEIARAHGRPTTAQDIIGRINLRAPSDTLLTRIGAVLNQVGRILARVIEVGSLAILVAVSGAWIWTLWLITLGYVSFHENLAFLNGWRQIVFVTAAYFVFAVPLYWLFRSFAAIAAGRGNAEVPRSSKLAATASVALWAITPVTVIAFGSVYIGEIQSYTDAHRGYLDYGKNNICLDTARCY